MTKLKINTTSDDHKVVAEITISGTIVQIGVYSCESDEKDSLYIFTDEQAEPTYFSSLECDLLIAALRAAQGDV